jgi:DNA-binding transcriptional ArsR family regulator
MKAGEIARTVSDLVRRVEALEAAARPAAGSLELVNGLLADVAAPDADHPGTVMYAGAGRIGDETIVYQMNRSWAELTTAGASPLASGLVALASPTRVAIVQTLLRGRASKADLSAALDEPSSGQLYHHLKELMAAGLIHQPERAVYAIPAHRVVPVLALLAAAYDLAHPATHTPTTEEPS